jgi:hypothetical protein
VVKDTALEVGAFKVDGVMIIWGLARGQLLAILPEEISSVAGGVQSGILPLDRVGAVIILDAILLEHARLSSSIADLGVGLDPVISPSVILDTP